MVRLCTIHKAGTIGYEKCGYETVRCLCHYRYYKTVAAMVKAHKSEGEK